tara:strand:- start:385 stop:540 length:156 start_codon:yes stop_codon:yes gene_type:complete
MIVNETVFNANLRRSPMVAQSGWGRLLGVVAQQPALFNKRSKKLIAANSCG